MHNTSGSDIIRAQRVGEVTDSMQAHEITVYTNQEAWSFEESLRQANFNFRTPSVQHAINIMTKDTGSHSLSF